MKKFKVLTSSAIVATMVLSSVAPAFAYSKEETVYSKLKTDGSEKTVIVSEHLKNDTDDVSLADESSLTDIKNVNGNEKFTQNGETITWTTKDGEDIYYQGKTDKKLPITMKISYRLDGKKMKLNDMLGKKGDVEITIEYTNNEKTTVDGKEYYVPFVIGTTTMIDTKNNSDVTVTNGKVISNGEKFVVGAVAAPGLYEDYDNNENLKDLNKVTITYKTKKFKLNSIMSAATPSLLSEDSLDVFDDLDDAYSKVDEMSSSFNQILEGGKKLTEGANELASKYTEFDSGVQSAAAGTSEAAKGAKELESGLATLNGKSAELNSGGSQVFAGVISLVDNVLQSNEQLKSAGISIPTLTTSNYKQVFSTIFSALGTESITQNFEAQIKSKVENDDAAIKDAKQMVTEGVYSKIIAEYVKQQLIDKGVAEPTEEQIKEVIAGMSDEQKSGIVEGYLKDQKNSDETKQIINEETVKRILAAENTQKQLNALIASGSAATAQLQQLEALCAGSDALNTGIAQYTAGVKQAYDGSKKLSAGLSELNTGMKTLASASTQLKAGIETLNAGSGTLATGLQAFNDQAISKLVDIVNNDIKGNVEKTETLLNISKDYKSFAGTKSDVESTTKFIMIVDGKSKK